MHKLFELGIVAAAFVVGVGVSAIAKKFAAKEVGKAEQIGQKEFDKVKGKL